MACWTLSALFIPIFIFALGVATDTSPVPPRYWHRPRHYGQALFLGAVLWTIGWFGPVFWVHRNAFDRPDLEGAANLISAMWPYLPAGVGALLAGLGILLLSTAYFRVGSRQHCRKCGYQRGLPAYRLTPTCPECGEIWSWFGATVSGEPRFSPARAAWGTLLAILGISGIVLQQFI